MPMPSVMTHDFSRVPRAEIPRSSFDRSHGLKTSFDAGYLIPVFWDEALPGDTMSLNMTAFARLATPLHPFMDNVYLSSFFFAVPVRLVWDNWQRFMGEQPNPGDSTDFLIPQNSATTANGYGEGTIFDYFGIPTKVFDIRHSVLPFRAYNLIWNEWFRDQNLQDALGVTKHDGPDHPNTFILKRRGKRHDYFTSALPWPQKGAAVDIPLGTIAPVRGIGIGGTGIIPAAAGPFRESYQTTDTTFNFPAGPELASGGVNGVAIETTGINSATQRPLVYADLTDATAATINQLRQAFQIQKLYERDARGGTRYTEIIRAHFNVVSDDARLQRPEYLGGGQSIVNLHTVPQTTQAFDTATSDTPQGNLAAYGTLSATGHGFTKSFTEHCILIGLVSVRADINYQHGLNRSWSRRTKFDFFWPALAHIGEQTVLNKEIFMQGPSVMGSTGVPADEEVFGYQERFAEYRYKPSQITGKLRSNSTTSLDTWHLGQDFAELPLLNAAFIEDNPPISRVIAVPSEPHFIMDAYFKYRCARPMPVYGVPGLMDHF